MNPMSAPVPPAGAAIKARPKARWIVLAILLVILGPGGCTAFAAVRIIGAVKDADDYGRYSLPARGDHVNFAKPVTDGALMAVTHGDGSPPEIRTLTLVGPNGSDVTLHPESSRVFTYTNGGSRARLAEIAQFTIDKPGTYVLTSSASGLGDGSQIWVGHHIDIAGIGIGALIGLLLFLVGVVMFIVVLVRRRRFRRSVQAPPGWGTPGAGYPPSPGGYPPPPGYGPPPAPGYGAPPAPGYGAPPPPGYGAPPTPTQAPPGQWGAPPAPAPQAPPPPAPAPPAQWDAPPPPPSPPV